MFLKVKSSCPGLKALETFRQEGMHGNINLSSGGDPSTAADGMTRDNYTVTIFTPMAYNR